MAQHLRTLVALTEDQGEIPSTYMVAHNPFVTTVPGDLTPSSVSTRHAHGAYSSMEPKYLHIENK